MKVLDDGGRAAAGSAMIVANATNARTETPGGEHPNFI